MRKGFTLVEVVFIVAILGILAESGGDSFLKMPLDTE